MAGIDAVCLLIIILIVIIVLSVVASGIKIIKEYERGVVFRLGRFKGIKEPGVKYVIPGLESMIKLDLRTRTVDIPPQDIITSDNIPIKVNAVLYFNVQDPAKAVLKVKNYQQAISQAALTSLRNVVSKHKLNDVLTQREKINHELREIIDEISDPWGIKVTAVEIKDILIPEGMQRAMAKQAEAEREKMARITKAEGEFIATQKLIEAARLIEEHPIALELRRMQMVTEVGAEQNTTTIVLVPSEFIEAARSISSLLKKD